MTSAVWIEATVKEFESLSDYAERIDERLELVEGQVLNLTGRVEKIEAEVW